MVDETLFVVIRDKDFMTEGQCHLLIMKGDPNVSIRLLHRYTTFSGIADVFTLTAAPRNEKAPKYEERLDNLRELGTVLKHVGTTRSCGEYSDIYTGLFSAVRHLPDEQQALELRRIIDRAQEELTSCVKQEELNGARMSTPDRAQQGGGVLPPTGGSQGDGARPEPGLGQTHAETTTGGGDNALPSSQRP